MVTNHGFTLNHTPTTAKSVQVRQSMMLRRRLIVAPAASTLDDVEAWLSSNRLRLNRDKTQVLWLGSKFQLLKVDSQDVPVLTTSVKNHRSST